MTRHHAAEISTPTGPLFAVVDPEGRLTRLDFVDGPKATRSRRELEASLAARGITLAWEPERLRDVAVQVERYFARELREFELELAPHGTPFQRSVWDALLEIPYGETWSYGQLAARLGKPNASRAVGRANGQNPIPLVIPCHRVIGANGTLTGYGGGLDRKRALLALEQGQELFTS